MGLWIPIWWKWKVISVEHLPATQTQSTWTQGDGGSARVQWSRTAGFARPGWFMRIVLGLLFFAVLILAAAFAVFLAAAVLLVVALFLIRYWILRWWQGKPNRQNSDATSGFDPGSVFRTQGYILINGRPLRRGGQSVRDESPLPPNVIEVPVQPPDDVRGV